MNEVWVYVKSEPNLFTVGYYTPDGEWMPESDHSSSEEAAKRVHYLNGGKELCMDCNNEERNPGLDVCGGCYHKRIWG